MLIGTFRSRDNLDDNFILIKVVIPHVSGATRPQNLIESNSVVVHFLDRHLCSIEGSVEYGQLYLFL